ncbi:MAG TPA: hypothetical protein VFL79_03270 [Terriglobia bacterium]|nr:hypothetical protein [Terriglobia bacterium]
MPRHPRNSLLQFGVAFTAAVLALPVLCAQTVRQNSNSGNPLVDRVTQVVTTFFAKLSDVECTELVSQTKFRKNGKVEYIGNSSFDYVVVAEPSGGELTLAESRLAKLERREARRLPLMVTNGFSTLLLIFHPEYRAGFEFNPLEDEVADGKTYARLEFHHIRGTRSTAALLVQGQEYPLDFQGVAWIDRETGEVWKIEAGLESPMDDIGLRSMRTEVIYGPVKFQGTSDTYWLPQMATIDVESLRERWRNVHRFTAYRQFATSVKETGSKTR